MGLEHGGLHGLVHAFHRRLFWLIVGAYLLAAVTPGPGLWMRSISLGTQPEEGGPGVVTLPAVMLAFLLFNAGLGVLPSQMRGLSRRPMTLLAGLAANLAVPLAFIFVVARAMTLWWHEPDEAQSILVGLALVASMPIAGSSSAWSQNAGGNLALSLGLVLGSTALSPLMTPVVLHAVGLMASGEYANRLHELAGRDTGAFLAAWVLLPSLLGLAARRLLGEDRAGRLVPVLKAVRTSRRELESRHVPFVPQGDKMEKGGSRRRRGDLVSRQRQDGPQARGKMGKPTPDHPSGTLGTLATLAFLTLGERATRAMRGLKIRVRRMFWKGGVLMRGLSGCGGLSGNMSPSLNATNWLKLIMR